jgi:DNA-binding NtrC family response regulator
MSGNLTDRAMEVGLVKMTKEAVAEAERAVITQAGTRARWQLAEMGRILKVTPKTVAHKMRVLGIPRRTHVATDPGRA